MATLVIPNCVQVAIEMVCSGQPVVNVLHFQYINGTEKLPAADLVAVKNEWEKAAGPLKTRPTLVTMVGYKYTDLSSPTGATTYLASQTGGGVIGPLSTMASAALVKMGGGTRSRSGSGRLYHGPLAESDVNTDGRTLATASLTNIQTAYNTFRGNLGLLGLELVVASRKNLSTSPATNISVSPIIATQRRRLR